MRGIFSFFLFFLLLTLIFPAIPCKTKCVDDIFFLNCGYRNLNGCGKFFPQRDFLISENGKRIKNYFKQNLGFPFYRPMDKSIFPSPPFGWCSYYYYNGEITPEDILENVSWISKNMKGFGLKYILIDAGWQLGGESGRNWFRLKNSFKRYGMKKLFTSIREKGFSPAIWISPFGTDDMRIVRKFKEDFINLRENNWLGRYIYFPSESKYSYIDEVFSHILDWDPQLIKVDGLPETIRMYKNIDGKNGIERLRRILHEIHKKCGEDVFLLGSWGIPIECMGFLNGARIGRDVRCGIEGALLSFRMTLKWFFLNNIVWYTDPDVLMVRFPIPFETAKIWATVLGLTGQVLMFSDRMSQLSEKRIKLLQKISPPQNIFPIYLFSVRRDLPIWDLKVKNCGKEFDVVAFFNFEKKEKGIFLDFSKIGLEGEVKYHLFDFWNEDYMGEVQKGIYINVLPGSVRVFVLSKVKDIPSLIATDRHIVQTKADIVKLNECKNFISGRIKLIGRKKVKLFFSYPEKIRYNVEKVEFNGKFEFKNHTSYSCITLKREKSGIYPFKIFFQKVKTLKGKKRLFPPVKMRCVLTKKGEYHIFWKKQYFPSSGYAVFINDTLYGYTFSNEIKIRVKRLDLPCKISVKSLWYNGDFSKKSGILFLKDNKKGD